MLPTSPPKPGYAAPQPPTVSPVRPTRFRESLQADLPVVDSAVHWLSFFQAICPVAEMTTPVHLLLPDTIFLSPVTGSPSLWYHSGASGILRRKATHHVAPNAILDALGSRHVGDAPVAICRFGFTSHLISRAQLETLCTQMNAHAVAPMIASDSSLDPPVPPFCLQRYIKPLDDKRYIVSYSLPIVSDDGKTASPSMCEAFLAQYSKRYNLAKGCGVMADSSTSVNDQRHHLFNNPQASFNFHVSLGTEEAKIVSPIMRMKHIATSLATTINSRKGARAQRIQGLVCEFIIGAHDDEVYFTAILGVSWQNQPLPSWDALRHIDPESKMIWTTPRELKAKDAPPSPQLQNPRFPSLANGDVTLGNDSWTRGLVSADRSPRYTNASPSKFFRDGRFVTKLSALQCETACRMHVPTHRACRPALLVDLARQVEDYREELVDQKEKCIVAEEAAHRSSEQTKIAMATKIAMEKTLADMRCLEEREMEQAARLCMTSEERETRAMAIIRKQAQAIEVLVARNTAEDISLRRELENCNEQLKQLHQTEVLHVDALAQKDEMIATLSADKEKARQQAIVDAMQREGAQSHIHTLRAQVVISKNGIV
ncbi:hypothetical protein SDRG_03881 [Saprolegnia diclina VS20]|uniref:Uncharacterized protein n=1 Tax=Saprolegnia diclina (strain VS20) TaxID=1156394 RepID=T0S1L9_SAPDV|nr:hypothetical protein SDRG_03881 [Saprolegnia diclina VS20]EQC38923.1 hypothetical protein SDRG_03881 [Saprolegnia diclina VS20]|eukprot:XP_008607747.1 hypothetical protein SDRG_03881 [Saprolegnia diclina VS20]